MCPNTLHKHPNHNFYHSMCGRPSSNCNWPISICLEYTNHCSPQLFTNFSWCGQSWIKTQNKKIKPPILNVKNATTGVRPGRLRRRRRRRPSGAACPPFASCSGDPPWGRGILGTRKRSAGERNEIAGAPNPSSCWFDVWMRGGNISRRHFGFGGNRRRNLKPFVRRNYVCGLKKSLQTEKWCPRAKTGVKWNLNLRANHDILSKSNG